VIETLIVLGLLWLTVGALVQPLTVREYDV
jgi:hypothetical protein